MEISIPSPLLALALVSLSACDLELDELRPKTDAECASFERACGYRCVSKTDPSTGCGGPSCQPCPAAPPGEQVFCNGSAVVPFCDYVPATVCGATQRDCDVTIPGCETDVLTNRDHCGACGHPCPNACVDGACTPDVVFSAAGGVGSIVEHAGYLYWVDGGSGGRLVRWDPGRPFTSASLEEVAWNLDTRADSPNVFWISSNPLIPSYLYMTGWSGLVPGEDFTIFRTDPVNATGATRIFGGSFAVSDGTSFIGGLAHTSSAVFFTRSDDPDPYFYDGVLPSAQRVVTAGPIRGLTGHGEAVWGGYPSVGGSVVSNVGTGDEIPHLIAGTGAPHRIAYRPGPPEEFFWASEADGSVHWARLDGSAPLSVFPGEGFATLMGIAADDAALVWSDRIAGTVWEWRWSDGAVFRLASGASPNGVAIAGGWVYWSDGSGYVMRVPR